MPITYSSFRGRASIIWKSSHNLWGLKAFADVGLQLGCVGTRLNFDLVDTIIRSFFHFFKTRGRILPQPLSILGLDFMNLTLLRAGRGELSRVLRDLNSLFMAWGQSYKFQRFEGCKSGVRILTICVTIWARWICLVSTWLQTNWGTGKMPSDSEDEDEDEDDCKC